MINFRKSNLEKIKSFIRNLEDGGIQKNDKEDLIKMIRPTIGIKTKTREDKNIKIGTSKIGGKPDLPQDFIWPKVNNKSMLFCAQYNLSELTKFDNENILPGNGFFYIFLGLDDQYKEFNGINQEFKFLYSKSEKLIRTYFPKDLGENHSFKTALIEYFQFYTIPDDQNHNLFEMDKRYEDLNFYFNEPTEDLIADLYPDMDNLHQILGYDRHIQSSALYDFASKELGLYGADSSEFHNRRNDILELASTLELLLQLDCYDSNSDMTRFGGSGTYYFGISKNDLKNQNFSNIKMSFQMT